MGYLEAVIPNLLSGRLEHRKMGFTHKESDYDLLERIYTTPNGYQKRALYALTWRDDNVCYYRHVDVAESKDRMLYRFELDHTVCGKIRVKRDILEYHNEFKFLLPDLQCPSLMLAVEKGVVPLVELLWVGEIVQGLARAGHLFSQGSEESLSNEEWSPGWPLSQWPEPFIGEKLDLVSVVFICMRDLNKQKLYKLRLSAILYLLPNYFQMYDGQPPIRKDGGIEAIADVFVKNGPGTSGVSMEMNEDEVFDFMQAGGVPYDVK